MSSSEKDDHSEAPSEEDSEAERMLKISKRKLKSKSGQSKPSSSKKRRNSGKYSGLLDEEAAEMDDEEEDYDEGLREEAKQLSKMEIEAHERVRRRQEIERKMTAEEYAANIEARYGRQISHGGDEYSDIDDDFDEDGNLAGGYSVSQEVAQQSLLPSITDPKLYLIKCVPGSEELLVLSVMNKALATTESGKKFGIISIVATGMKGYLYLEAHHEPSAREAINGLRKFYQSTMSLVPIKDMTSVLATQNRTMPVEEGQYVRLTRFPYKDDLARVERVINYGEKVVVQFIPRIHLANIRASKEEKKARQKIRPSQKWFDSIEITNAGGQVERKKFPTSGDYMDNFENGFYKNGFQFKEVNVNTFIRTRDINPTLEELTKFRSRLDKKMADVSDVSDLDDDDEVVSKPKGATQMDVIEELKAIQAKEGPRQEDVPLFAMNDIVIVISGDLKDLKGKVEEVSGSGPESVIKIRPLDALMADNVVTVQPRQIVKFFNVGAHVRVMEGMYSGETGTIVKLLNGDSDDMIAVVLGDLTSKELQVRVAHLQESMEVAQGLDSLGGIEVEDLIMIGPTDVAMVISVGREDVETLNASGVIKRVRPEESRGNRNVMSSKAVVNDAENNPIRVGNDVTVIEGKFARKTGTIKHIFRTTLWLHNSKHVPNRGVFVARARSCVLSGRRQDVQTAASGYMGSVQNASEKLVKDFRNRTDEILGKTVKLIKGPYKGHLGLVVEASETHVKVEMATKHKKITFEREKIRVVGDREGIYTGNGGENVAPGFSQGTSVYGRQTPIHAFETPLHASRTPMHDRTPTHNPGTPSRDLWRPGAIDTPSHQSSIGGELGSGEGGYADWGDSGSNANTGSKSWGEEDTNTAQPSAWGVAEKSSSNTQASAWGATDDSNKTTQSDAWGSIGETIKSTQGSSWGSSIETSRNTQLNSWGGTNEQEKSSQSAWGISQPDELKLGGNSGSLWGSGSNEPKSGGNSGLGWDSKEPTSTWGPEVPKSGGKLDLSWGFEETKSVPPPSDKENMWGSLGTEKGADWAVEERQNSGLAGLSTGRGSASPYSRPNSSVRAESEDMDWSHSGGTPQSGYQSGSFVQGTPPVSEYSPAHPTGDSNRGLVGNEDFAWAQVGAMVTYLAHQKAGFVIHRSISDITVKFSDETTFTDKFDAFEPVPPAKGSKVRVISGIHCGREGRLRLIDDSEAHVKIGTDLRATIVKVHEIIRIT